MRRGTTRASGFLSRSPGAAEQVDVVLNKRPNLSEIGSQSGQLMNLTG